MRFRFYTLFVIEVIFFIGFIASIFKHDLFNLCLFGFLVSQITPETTRLADKIWEKNKDGNR